MRYIALLACLVSCAALPGGEAPPLENGFDARTMWSMQRISDPQVSPDGAWVLHGLRTIDMEGNRGLSDLWLTRVDGSESKQLTTHEASDWNGRWMPDGESVLFLSARGDSPQVWRVSLRGGEAAPLTDLPVAVSEFAVFPDGERLLLSLDVHPDAESLEQSAERDAELADAPTQARVYDELLFRHWDEWEDHKRRHLFVWNVAEGGEPIDLMKGLDVDCPTRPFGGLDEASIAPDGTRVVFKAKDGGRTAAWSTDTDLYTVPADGSAAPRCITSANEAYDSSPAFSPDGKYLAYTAMARPQFEADRLSVVLLDLRSGERRILARDWDRSAGSLVWSPDSKTIYTSAADMGNRALFSIDVATGRARALVEKGTNHSPCPAGDHLVFVRDTLSSPAELYRIRTGAWGGEITKITSVNDARLADVAMGEYEQFSFPGWNDETVRGYVMKPANFEEGRKYPVAFLIHGGPQGSFGDHFHYRWNPQVYAGAGYAAVFIDFHGSTGYGQSFTDSISGDWGGKPYVDLMKGLDWCLERYDFLDGDRVAALGASYGGYMINWIAGQTDRFRCLVNHDGVFDTRSMYFETEELWFPEFENGGTPWDVPQNYAKHNPAEFVKNWETPMLVIHGALDFRVPESQGMAAFTALQRRGVPSKFLYFPEENHWVLKPQNGLLWHDTVLEWLDQWTGTGS